MNNLYLNDLIKNSSLHPDDAKNINRIFYILSEERKKHVIDNWIVIVTKIKASREKMNTEKYILDAKMNNSKTSSVSENVKKEQENMFND